MNWNSKKLNLGLTISTLLLSIILLFQLTGKFRFRLDMTEEKRYTLSDASKAVLDNLNEPILIESFLEGELPSNFKRFRGAIEDLLDQLAIYGGSNFQYRFIDPSQAKSSKSRNEYYRSLVDKGLQPTNLTYTKDGQKSEKLVFPGVIITYGNRELAVPLLKGNRSATPEEMLNQSVEGLEYELISAIKGITTANRKRVGYIIGHGEPDSTQLAGFTNAILTKYDLFKVNLSSRTTPLTGYDVLVIGKPTDSFSEIEKYLLDQFVMNGGNLLMFIDALSVDVRGAEGEGTIALPYDLNLEDLLFRYGIRINQNYVIDFHSGFFPGVRGTVGNQPKIELLPWPFFPIISSYGEHPLVRGLDATILKFASTLDTVKAPGVTKTPLLLTSEYTKVLSPPVQVKFSDWQDEVPSSFFQSGPKVTGYLLEGNFNSLYKNRVLPTGVDTNGFLEDGQSARIIVISDGDFIRNDFNIQSGEPLPLGVDPYVRTTYANEELLLRSLDHLANDAGLTLVRNKEVKIRPLDRVKIKNERTYWVLLNGGLPMLLVIMFGIVKYIIRKRKYAK